MYCYGRTSDDRPHRPPALLQVFPMTAGIDFYYGDLPYQYPPVDTQPCIRVPVAGPRPFNTLAIVRGVGPGAGGWSNGATYRSRATILTGFLLAGFDQRVPPAVQHSTLVALHRSQSTTDCEFLFATDTITGSFSSMGVWTVQVDTAGQADDQALAEFGFTYSSWVMCYEPPIVNSSPPAQSRKLANEEIPNMGFVLPAPYRPGDQRRSTTSALSRRSPTAR